MKLSTICSEDWQEFKEKFPSAYLFLLHKSLQGEYRILASTAKRNAWEEERYIELLKELKEV